MSTEIESLEQNNYFPRFTDKQIAQYEKYGMKYNGEPLTKEENELDTLKTIILYCRDGWEQLPNNYKNFLIEKYGTSDAEELLMLRLD